MASTGLDLTTLLMGGMGIGMIGGLWNNFLAFLRYCISFCVRFFVTTIEINSTSPLYRNFSNWAHTSKYAKSCPILQISRRDQITNEVITPIGQGIHFFKHDGLCIIAFKRASQSSHESGISMYLETVKLILLTRNQNKIRGFVEEISLSESPVANKTSIFSNYYDTWTLRNYTDKREMSSIFIEDGIKQKILKTIDSFINGRDFFKKHNIPYKTGLLFAGKPGVGKSSLIRAIATTYNLNIYYLNLSSTESDFQLLELFKNCPSDALIVIEDIDTVMTDRKIENNGIGAKALSFGTVLNLLDGVISKEGQIIIATTNHIEKLDPALLRAGRFDCVVEIPLPSNEIIQKFVKSFEFSPDQEKIILKELSNRSGLTIADAQEFILNRGK